MRKQISKVCTCDAVLPEMVEKKATLVNSFFKLADSYFPKNEISAGKQLVALTPQHAGEAVSLFIGRLNSSDVPANTMIFVLAMRRSSRKRKGQFLVSRLPISTRARRACSMSPHEARKPALRASAKYSPTLSLASR